MKYRSFWAALLGAALMHAATAQDARWDQTLERIATGVVSIRIDATRAFDTERNESSQATGFVVDAERGLILTNRHVVAPGPVWTPLIRQSFDNEKVQECGKDSPMERPAQPAELAPAFVFLASNESSYVNGEVLGVTGGKPLG